MIEVAILPGINTPALQRNTPFIGKLAASNLRYLPDSRERKISFLNKLTSKCVIGSNVSNIGICLDFIRKFFRSIPGLEILSLVFEALIYVFKAIYHLSLIFYARFLKKDSWNFVLLTNDIEKLAAEELYLYAEEGKITYIAAGMQEFAEIYPSELGQPIPATWDELITIKEHILEIASRRNHIRTIPLEYRKFGWHKYHIYADIACLILFIITICALSGVPHLGNLEHTNSVGEAIGWATGLLGVGINLYFDYVYQSKLAKIQKDKAKEALFVAASQYEANKEMLRDAETEYKNMIMNKNVSEAERSFITTRYLELQQGRNNYLRAKEAFQFAKHDYEIIRDSKRLYIAVLIGLFFLLVCGSVAAFAPPAVAPIFLGLKYFGMGMIVLINIGRLVNWWKPEWKNKIFPFWQERISLPNFSQDAHYNQLDMAPT